MPLSGTQHCPDCHLPSCKTSGQPSILRILRTPSNCLIFLFIQLEILNTEGNSRKIVMGECKLLIFYSQHKSWAKK